MKQWQSILISMGLAAAVAGAQQIPNQAGASIATALLTALAGAIAAKTSKSNPDGTPAQAAWIPTKK